MYIDILNIFVVLLESINLKKIDTDFHAVQNE